MFTSIYSDDGETCQLSSTSIHIIKEEYDMAGNVVRNCEGDIVINKCEGTCTSSLEPSVTSPTGFLKVSLSFSRVLFSYAIYRDANVAESLR